MTTEADQPEEAPGTDTPRYESKSTEEIARSLTHFFLETRRDDLSSAIQTIITKITNDDRTLTTRDVVHLEGELEMVQTFIEADLHALAENEMEEDDAEE